MIDEKRLLYTIWLNQSCGHDPDLIHRILKKYQTPEAAFSANHFDGEFFKTLQLKRMLKLDRTLDSARRLLDECREKGIEIFDREDARYPELLKNIFHSPTVLYAKGALPDLNRMLGVSVVGTRRPTKDGEEMARTLSRGMAENGICIVSGMAMGIDGAAHCGALEAGGTTLAILAGGVDVIYPTQHADMYQHILTHGAVLSEQPPGTIGKPTFYKQRNRIIAGLSLGTLVVEGDVRSGTSMTARLATENNRDVFAVPGSPLNPAASLPNTLIRDGAKQTTGPLDVLEEYLELYPDRLEYGLSRIGKPVVGKVDALNHPPKIPVIPVTEKKQPTYEERSHRLERKLSEGDFRKEEMQILRYLCQKTETVSYDELAEQCAINPASLSSMLIILQMKGLVRQSAGGHYCLQLDFS